jgi:hypothetical protein
MEVEMRIEQATRNDVPAGELDELKRELASLQTQLEDEEQ